MTGTIDKATDRAAGRSRTTGTVSGKSATFIFAGALTPGDSSTGTTAASGADPAALEVTLIEDPFSCNNEARIFGGLAGASANEQVSFTSPQATGISPGTADADGNLDVRWVCGPEQVGTTWEITATGVDSGRSVTFSLTGS